MVHIYKDYYCDTDGDKNITLYTRTVIQDVKRAKQENMGKDKYVVLGYYQNIENMIEGIIRREQLSIVNNPEIKEIEEVVRRLIDTVNEIKGVLNITELQKYITEHRI